MPDVNTSDVPWAMQIALRVEKSDPPSDIDACEAAARACVGLIVEAERRAAAPLAESDEAVVDTSWLEAVDAWRGIAIRKIVRRARGKRWDDAQTVPGFTCTQGRAEARAFVPAPVKPLPPELAKMQVEGTALPAGESTTENAMVTVRISPLVEMTSGKTAAQCAHAAQRAWEAMPPDERSRWANDGHRVRVVRDTEAAWAADAGRVSIIDAGFTELEGQHETTRANW
ncbi:peptidyl-tRNA hydrolase [Dermacoccus sp. Tok2021]|nr:peptidyl-tRNA hydrolase [Dermacoccus sp. Tok2021]MBZ4497878.1 peptidyl-tRNA hydrolase [Dermacoccus sp. Tok2021]